jgi:hypothetical protein
VPPERAERKLAAILAADVAGYSRLMGADEEGTLARFKDHRRELIDPKIAEHRGRVVKATGDGILIEFPSVVDAVRCAIDVQRGMVGRNADIPKGSRIEFRVGVNLGDIIIDGDDIHGDGVNIAARLEGIAEPGSVFISESSYQQVRDKLDIGFERLRWFFVIARNLGDPIGKILLLGIASSHCKDTDMSKITPEQNKAPASGSSLCSSEHLHEIPNLSPCTLAIEVEIRLDANPGEEYGDQLTHGFDVCFRIFDRDVRPKQLFELGAAVRDHLPGFCGEAVELPHRIHEKAAPLIKRAAWGFFKKSFDVPPPERLRREQRAAGSGVQVMSQASHKERFLAFELGV